MDPLIQFIITARIRSLGQGNVFTRTYHSVHREGGDLPPDRDSPWTEIPPGRDVPLDRDPPLVLTSSGSHRSGWYASYWNAYLFSFSFVSKVNTTELHYIAMFSFPKISFKRGLL